jgi:hypothetical protein
MNAQGKLTAANHAFAALRQSYLPENVSILGFIQIFMNAPTTTFLTYTLTLSNLPSPIVHNEPTGTDCPGTCILGGTFFIPTSYHPVSGTLTVHLNDEMINGSEPTASGTLHSACICRFNHNCCRRIFSRWFNRTEEQRKMRGVS